MFYLSRSGVDIHDTANSGFDIPKGHLTPAAVWGDAKSDRRDVSGGWYDAGDFGRYMTTAAVTVSQLLLAYEANPSRFADSSLKLPESGNRIPDLLDEIAFELRWMLKLQRADGAVHHKVTTRDWGEFGILPSEDTQALYLFEPTTNDTAYFTAAMARAARVFRAADPAFADQCEKAALAAWAWLKAHPEQVPPGGFKNPPESEFPMQGGYDFAGDEAEARAWAAAALNRARPDPEYLRAYAAALAKVQSNKGYRGLSWTSQLNLALHEYAVSANADAKVKAESIQRLVAQADEVLAVSKRTGYRVSLAGDGTLNAWYSWGSNQFVAANAVVMLLANEVAPNTEFVQAAYHQLQYIFGINGLGRFYFTGLGRTPPATLHHQVSRHFGRPFPGFMGQGANGYAEGSDPLIQELVTRGTPPGLCFVDDWESYSSNEPTIDGNGTFVAMLALLTR